MAANRGVPDTAAADPFAALSGLADTSALTAAVRAPCPTCARPRRYYCYDCRRAVGSPPPALRLPVPCDVLYWHTELRSKSTAVHCAVLAPDDTRWVECHGDDAEIPEYDPDTTVLLFPSPDAVPLESCPLEQVQRVVFIEAQWHSAPRILRLPRVKALRCVRIGSYQTLFWRWQTHGPDHLATIEAIYYFYKELLAVRGEDTASVDNLLYYYAHQFRLIQRLYTHKGIEFPRNPDYIRQ